MAPSISGHGGNFKLVGRDYRPTIDFTLPLAPRQVSKGNESLREAVVRAKNPAWTQRPVEDKSTLLHPNDHDTEAVELSLHPSQKESFDEEVGVFCIQRPTDDKATRMNFVVRYYHQSAPNQTITIGDRKPAVTLNFQGEAGFYIAVVLYDFRKLEDDIPTGHKRILFDVDHLALKHEASRPCYLYVAAAKAEPGYADPQSPQHGATTLPGASLVINANELSVAMGADSRPARGNGETLYHAAAAQIDDSNLTFRNRLVNLTTIAKQDVTPLLDGQDVIFTVDRPQGALPLGLYLVAFAPGEEPPTPGAVPGVPAPLNLNSASIASLLALNGIGPVLADRINTYRRATPFSTIEEIKEVSGIGDGIFAQIKDEITV